MRAFVAFLFLAATAAVVTSVAIKKTEENAVLTDNERELLQQYQAYVIDRTAEDLTQLQLLDQALQKRAPSGTGSCSVTGYTSQCCGNLSFKVLWQTVNLDACVLGEVLPSQYGIHVKLTVLGSTIIDETVSAHDPPALCKSVPGVSLASICVDLSNLQWENDFSGCVAIKAKVFGATVADVDLGCFQI